NIFWETHTARENFVAKKVAKKVAGIISITQGLKDFYVKNFGIEPKKILVASDGVDLENFSFEFSKGEFKKKENLSLNKKIIFYSGHLYDWKGAQILADASVYLNENNLVVFVGGTDEDIEFFKKRNNHLKNVIIIGHRKYSEMPSWQKSADVLVLPNTEKQDISKYHTSPMKLFEYMASGNPIVASNLPSIGEILNEKNSILVEPDNPKSLADGINKALNDVELGENLAKQALIDVQNYTWKKRVNNILNFIK
ncbi:glycosyltransferase family 4 protein, partial [Candidatus Parcubacteria bacterium]|nr:glycosyltransferase family 4 protein [Candidatus Parcubacteria bacterium]